MRIACLAIVAFSLPLVATSVAKADVGPPIDCTVAERSNNSQECVECTATDCATSLGAGYTLECTQSGGTEIWCRPVVADESGCTSAVGAAGKSLASQLIFASLLALFGLALYRRSRSRS